MAALVEWDEGRLRIGPCAGCALVELDGERAHVGLTEDRARVGSCAVAALVELDEGRLRIGPCAGCALVELDGGRAHVWLTEG